jgi:hypothetical protein
MDLAKSIEDLSHKWCADIGGLNVLVPIGAAMNIIKTASNQAPQDVRDQRATFLQMMAKDLTGERH